MLTPSGRTVSLKLMNYISFGGRVLLPPERPGKRRRFLLWLGSRREDRGATAPQAAPTWGGGSPAAPSPHPHPQEPSCSAQTASLLAGETKAGGWLLSDEGLSLPMEVWPLVPVPWSRTPHAHTLSHLAEAHQVLEARKAALTAPRYSWSPGPLGPHPPRGPGQGVTWQGSGS